MPSLPDESIARAKVAAEDAPAPAEPKEPDQPQASPAPLASKWPWWATFLVGAILLAIFIIWKVVMWNYVLATNEDDEKNDLAQLQDIVASFDAIVVLVIGAIFGVGTTQGVSKAAADTAEKNKEIADKNAKTAKDNATAAKTNDDRARKAEATAENIASAFKEYAASQSSDSSRRYIQSFRYDATSSNEYIIPAGMVANEDTGLTELAASAQSAVAALKSSRP